MKLFHPSASRGTRRSARHAVGVVAVAVLPLGLWAAPASAHDGGAEIEVDAAHEIPGGIHYIVEVTYDDDGHPAPDATVTATAIDPDGETAGQVELEVYNPDAGLYDGVVEMDEPGEWTVRFAALDPDGSLDHTQEIVTDDTAGEADGGDDPGDVDAGPEAETEPEVFQSNEDTELTVDEVDDSDDGPSVVLLGLVFLVLGAAVALVFWLVMKRKDDAGPDAAGGDDGGADAGPDAAGDDDGGADADEAADADAKAGADS